MDNKEKKRLSKYFRHSIVVGLETIAVIFGVIVFAGGLLLWQLMGPGIKAEFLTEFVEQSLNSYSEEYSISLESVAITWPDISAPVALDMKDVHIQKFGKDFLDIQNIQLGIYARRLLVGELRPSSLRIKEPILNMIRTEDNAFSFDMGMAGIKASNPALEDVEKLLVNPLQAPVEAMDVPQDGTGAFTLDIKDRNSIKELLETIVRGIPVEGEDTQKADLFAIFDHMSAIIIEDAFLSVDDRMLGKIWSVESVGFSLERNPDNLALYLQAQGGQFLGKDTALNASIVYFIPEAEQDTKFKLGLQNFDPMVLSEVVHEFDWAEENNIQVTLESEAQLSSELELKRAGLKLSSDQGKLFIPELYDVPVTIDGMNLKVSYDHTKNMLKLENAKISLGGVELQAKTEISTENTEDLQIPLSARIPLLEQSQIGPLWPSAFQDEGAKEWLVDKLSKGRFEEVTLDVGLHAYKVSDASVNQDFPEGVQAIPASQKSWKIDTGDVKAGFVVKDMDIDYRAPLSPIVNAQGSGEFLSTTDELTLHIEAASLLDMRAEKGKVVLTNIMAGDGEADIQVGIKGPLPSMFRYIKDEPIALSEEELGIAVDKVKGDADVTVNVSFPTIRDVLADQVKVKVAGTLSETVLPGVVNEMDLTGGPFKFSAAEGKIILSGDKGLLDKRPVKFNYIQYLETQGSPYSSKVDASLSADPVLRDKLGIDLSDFVEGPVFVDVTYTQFDDNHAEAVFKGDLKNSVIKLDPFDYRKPSASAGTATGSIAIDSGRIREVRELAVKTADLDIKNARLTFRPDGEGSELDKGQIPSFKLFETNVSIEFEIDKDDAVRAQLKGPFFDARPFLRDSGDDKKEGQKKAASEKDLPYTGPRIIALLETDKIRTHELYTVDKAKVYFDFNKQGKMQRFEMDGIAGKGEVYLRYKPNEQNLMTLRLEADDAGALLRSFDIYKDMRGGKLALYGEAKEVGLDAKIEGDVQIADFKVVNAPVLGRLLSLAGPAAIPALLSGDGMNFSRLESGFGWRLMDGGDIWSFSSGKASAASLRLTFDGSVDQIKDKWDMSGTIVPLSLINSFVSNIPIVGDILAGGKDGAVLAATYTVKGTVSDPQVNVNPLSALAPGILRRLLFEDEKKDK